MRFVRLSLLAVLVGVAGAGARAAENPCDEEYCKVSDLPFDPNRSQLYSVKDLWGRFDPIKEPCKSLDYKIFCYFKKETKYTPSLEQYRSQYTHDAGMDWAIDTFLGLTEGPKLPKRKVVMILGSHSKYRSDLWYGRVARLTYRLTKSGYFVATGGGPGLMEAANLGAYMAGEYTEKDLEDALGILEQSKEPLLDGQKQFEMDDFWSMARSVVTQYPRHHPDSGESLGVPTWFYGHEGANVFASHIAKYFSNGLRETKMTTLAIYGTIFAPGGPGTSQEVFADAAENTYDSRQWFSPMIFFNDDNDDTVKKLVDAVKDQRGPLYKHLDYVTLSDDPDDIIRYLDTHPPIWRMKND